MAITIIQERRTERPLEALRDLSSPRALVIRDGIHRRIAVARQIHQAPEFLFVPDKTKEVD
jgi:ABC-type transport system involved in Fe-S cluster assembly fused permease/ATPase subunit